MKNPLIDFIRQVRAERSKELARDLKGALEESRRRTFMMGHDVVSFTSGERRVIYKAPRKPEHIDSHSPGADRQAGG